VEDLYFRQIKVGPMENFAYLLGSKAAKKCLIVDPAWDVDTLLESAAQDEMQISGVLVTHFHPDHCGGHLWGHSIPGVAELLAKISVPVYVNKHEAEGVGKVTGLGQSELTCVLGGDEIEVGTTKIKCIHTPGHSPGSQCFLVNGHLVAGDTLFLSGCGRVDLPGGNAEDLTKSLHGTLSRLPDSTIVFPGHDYDSKPFASLAEVKKINPYLKAD
jgi:hydroxyacylglutathione hydrolase